MATISPAEALEWIQKGIALYNRIRHEAPEQVKKAGKHMERLERYLVGLQGIINDPTRHALGSLGPSQTGELQIIIDEIKVSAKAIYEIVDKWDNYRGPFGFRFASAPSHVLFAIGSSPEKLSKLTEDIQDSRYELRDYLQLLGYFGINELVGRDQRVQGRTPSPRPPGREYSVLFVDPQNLGRSKVAEAYIKLLREWTARTHGTWRIKFAHSAGILIRNKCDCVGVLGNLNSPTEMKDGKLKPNMTALSALFDGPYWKNAYADDVREDITSRRSRGINRSIFKTYDCIVVFHSRELQTLTRLKQELVSSSGSSVAPKGKGRLIQLGSYLLSGREPINILDAARNPDGTQSWENWEKTVRRIKMSIKEFLKCELDWTEPS
ncbi:MAG: hypothetical protein M1820_008684 [Bogoriella megaspora]|nr:MAG: hypothetical protein M1820_008684 [Bogoriella megaspora]